ncbi:MAG: hypothetical protein DME48_03020 [Verrucomicrobia bacterium]|nr:MAG: hypothetical protein DME48_03020 [Verrucomicrobiota bacterium]
MTSIAWLCLWSHLVTLSYNYGRGCGLGRILGVGVGLGVELGVAVAVGVGIGPDCAQYLPPVPATALLWSITPPQTIISVPVQTAE